MGMLLFTGPLVQQALGVTFSEWISLPTEFQRTTEREVDFLFQVVTKSGDAFVLHLEFQSSGNRAMVYRVGEYHGIVQRIYKLRIEHVVIYIGDTKHRWVVELPGDQIFTGFKLVNLIAQDPERFLSSMVPEQIILAILADFEKSDAEDMVPRILQRLRSVCHNAGELSKYIQQLLTLSRLRKLEHLTSQKAEDMPITYDIETDYLYLRGMAKGKVEGQAEGKAEGKVEGKAEGKVKFALACHARGMDIAVIAEIVGLTQDEVAKIISEHQIE